MVYGETKSDYKSAIKHLNSLSERIFTVLSTEKMTNNQAWFQASLSSEIEGLLNSRDVTLKKIGTYVNQHAKMTPFRVENSAEN